MNASDIQPGRAYRDWRGNIYRIREIFNGRAYFHIDGFLIIPLASAELDELAAAMAMEFRRKGQRD